MEYKIICALCGLVGAVENNDKTERTDSLIIDSLLKANCNMQQDEIDEVISLIEEEKYLISPGCQMCAAPCGNTSTYQMDDFYSEPLEIQNAKKEMIETIISVLERNSTYLPSVIYQGLSAFSKNYDVNTYSTLINNLKELQK